MKKDEITPKDIEFSLSGIEHAMTSTFLLLLIEHKLLIPGDDGSPSFHCKQKEVVLGRTNLEGKPTAEVFQADFCTEVQ